MDETSTMRNGENDSRWSATIDKIRSFRSLFDDWDGEGSPAPRAELVDSALSHARDLQTANFDAPDRVAVTVNGTIVFEWHTATDYREVEVQSPLNIVTRSVDRVAAGVSVGPSKSNP